MPAYFLRVWVPDRPGALGAVASRIGAVRGDLIGIDILERGGGRAIDELVVDLPDPSLVPLLVSEVGEVDGVDVEDVRPAGDHVADPRLDALETAADLVGQATVHDLLGALAVRSARDFQAEWAAVIDPAVAFPLASVGLAPAHAWLQAFVAGSRLALVPPAPGARPGTPVGAAPKHAGRDAGPDDVAWAELVSAGLVVVLGRDRRRFRARERRQLTALARIADHRWVALGTRPAGAPRPAARA